MYTYPLRSISIISLTGRKTEEQKTGKNCPLLYLLLALSLFSVCLPCPCWSVLPFVRIHSLYPQSLHLKVSTRTHIMSTDEEGSENFSDGGDAVAQRQRKHARDASSSLPKLLKASKIRKVQHIAFSNLRAEIGGRGMQNIAFSNLRAANRQHVE